MKAIRYQPIVHHDGTCHLLGRWFTGKAQDNRSKAEADGRKELARCRAIVGGNPSLEIKIVLPN